MVYNPCKTLFVLAFYNNHINHRGVCRISQGDGAQLKNFLDLGSACRKPLLWGFAGMHPQEDFLKWCNFVRYESYFQPLS